MNRGSFALVPARVQGPLQSVENEVRLHRTADPLAHDVSREGIDDEGDVGEALPGRDVGEVGDLQVVRTISLEVPVHPIQRTRRLGSRHRGAHRLASASTTQPAQPYQSKPRPPRRIEPDLHCRQHLALEVRVGPVARFDSGITVAVSGTDEHVLHRKPGDVSLPVDP